MDSGRKWNSHCSTGSIHIKRESWRVVEPDGEVEQSLSSAIFRQEQLVLPIWNEDGTIRTCEDY